MNLELDLKAKAMNFTKDPSWNYQWNLQQIGLETALTAIGQETKNVAVAVLDSGSPSSDSTAYTTSAFLPNGFDFVPIGNSGDGMVMIQIQPTQLQLLILMEHTLEQQLLL